MVKNPKNTGKSKTKSNQMRKLIFAINTTLDGCIDEILKLKQEEGKDIHTGGVTLASQLAELGLIDEYRFLVHPIVVGEGRRLFEGINLQEKLRLRLVESKVFKSGVVVLRFLKQ
jgi:dihydrofolate reductase